MIGSEQPIVMYGVKNITTNALHHENIIKFNHKGGGTYYNTPSLFYTEHEATDYLNKLLSPQCFKVVKGTVNEV